ncbi:MAG: glutaredoxin domain-containing protein [Burkholderiales bacterium]
MRYLIAAILSAAAFSAGAQLYRWTDQSGKVHYTDSPPPPAAKDVRKRAAGAPAASGDAAEPYALQTARRNFPVKLYSTPSCPPCDAARKLLNVRGVPFTEVSVTNEAGIAELKQAAGGDSVPALIVGSTVQNGFEEGAYHRALDAAGYPKTGILPPRTQAEPRPDETRTEAKPPPEPEPARGPYAPGARR